MSEAAVDLDYDVVLRDACERAGVGAFSNEFYLPVVRRLLEGFDHEANLNATGRAIQRERIVGQLATNLRFESYWQQYPEIAQEKIEAPIVIVGFGRTGSTLLQRLLAADPRAHAPLWWEGRFPVPFAGESIENPEQRIKTALAEVEMMYATVPGLESIHPLDAMQADEEILLLEQSFYSDTPESFAKVLEFGLWREALDQTPGYAYMKRMLQFLQWQKRKRGALRERWVLKTPGHLGYLDTLMKVFPGALIVQTHRDPVHTIPSAASLNRSLWRLSSDAANDREIGRQWQQRMKWAVERCLASREKIPPEQIADVWFKDALGDPLGVVAKIYATFGIDLTPEARAALEQWLRDNRRDKRPPHEYTLAEFGMTEQQIRSDFAAYRRRFIEPRDA